MCQRVMARYERTIRCPDHGAIGAQVLTPAISIDTNQADDSEVGVHLNRGSSYTDKIKLLYGVPKAALSLKSLGRVTKARKG